nr:MAG TPA: Terminase small subunit [Caudoviricetes sp.]
MAKLTVKQQRFVDEYLIDLNATQAAIRAGYKKSEYTDTNANKLLENTRIRDAIDMAMAERSRRTGINQDRVVQELAKLAFVNIANVVDLENVEILPTATDEDLACIQSIKLKPGEFGDEKEIKLYDKKGALETLGKHLGMFRDKMDVSMTVPVVFVGEDQLEE